MKSRWSRILIAVGFGLAALVLELSTGLTGWAFVCLLGGFLIYVLVRGQEVRKWLNNPLQPMPLKSAAWEDAAKQVTRSIEHSRGRSHTLLQALKRIRSTSDYLPDAWITLHQQHEIETFNLSAQNLLGIKPSDIGADLTTLIRHPSLNRLLTEDAVEIVEIASPIDDAKRLEIRVVELDQSRQLVIARDISELNRLLTMRQDFIANVSHELRTPLTVMLGYVESMTNDELSEETLRELAKRLVTPVDRMRFMVDDLLTLTQLESAPLPTDDEIQSINGQGEIASVIDEARSLTTPDHLLKLEVDPDLYIECVPSEIHSAFLNLVTNAIRYSPDGGEITIRLHREGEYARFEVEDQGVGIPPESISRLTERFYRVDMKVSRARGGTGLGLAIVKHVLRRHQSELQIRSTVGKGSQFFFDLPLTSCAQIESRVIQ
ncbi:MAG: phosphate regulon sensor histidine kinase PhoR [Gammaproteobacteria bacterium]|nr:phosphate regulon sensor histidine kinase PhoR [Gammaproteobacteria bacterium]